MRRCARTAILPFTLGLALAAGTAWPFTQEQAAVGSAAYAEHCATCHGTSMRQLPEALIAGREFVAEWRERGVDELVEQIRTSMPPVDPGGLTNEAYLGITAYVLQANGGVPDEQPMTAATAARIGDRLTGEPAPPAALAGGAPGGPIGVTVAGTVPDFEPVTDAVLRDPAHERRAGDDHARDPRAGPRARALRVHFAGGVTTPRVSTLAITRSVPPRRPGSLT